MSSISLKDLTKSLTSTFSLQSSPKPEDGYYRSRELPAETQQTIEAYLDKHETLDDNDSQRLQEELLTLYQKYVVPDSVKLAAFLQVLRQVSPLLNGQARLEVWWETAISPIINGIGHKRVEIEHANEFLLAILDYDADADTAADKAKTSSHFTKLLLDAYLKRTRMPDSDSKALPLEDQYIARQLENSLIAFGHKKPKDFLLAIDRLVFDRNHRMQALGLLSAFVRLQPPRLYLVTQTPLIEHILKCLMIDTSSTVTSLALSCLIMFLPHIPSSVKAHLPRLFLIYSRLLCWNRFVPSPPNDDNEHKDPDNTDENHNKVVAEQEQAATEDEGWEKLHSSFDNADSTAPELIHYFTFLYGLYPLNFINYIRKPRRYLKDIKFPRAEDFDLDQAIIRSRTEQFRRIHLIHPNFYTTTVEEELTDNRWLKSDPSDVVSECMSLCIAGHESTLDGGPLEAAEVAPQYLRTEDIPRQCLVETEDESALLSRPNEDIQSETLAASSTSHSHPGQRTPSTTSPATSSPAVHPLDDVADSPTPCAKSQNAPYFGHRAILHESVYSFQTSSSNPYSPSMLPVSRAQMPRSPAVRPVPQSEANMAFLQREVMLLRNDLNFERYLKQQQLSHIGQLQRRHIAEATVEAETQNLINTNRTLKAKLAQANEAYASIKKEAANGRNQTKKWESEMTTRARTLREEEKLWRATEESLRDQMSRIKADCDHLRQLVVDSESKELLAQQELTFASIKLELLDDFKTRTAVLDGKVLEYQAKDLLSDQRRNENEHLKEELAAANLVIQSQDTSQDCAGKHVDCRIRDLEAQLLAAQNPTAGAIPGQLAPHVQAFLDTAVAASNAKFAALDKESVALKLRNTELEMRLKTQAEPPKPV